MPVRSNIKIQVGPVATTVSIDSGIASTKSDPTVCLGQPGHEPHEPVAGTRPHTCAKCGPIVDYTRTAKARKVGDTYSLLPAEEVAALTKDHALPFLDPVFTPSPREQVDAGLVPGGKLYYLNPQGLNSNYANLRSMIRGNPDLAFVGRFTVKSAVSVFTLEVRGDVLVLVERTTLEGAKPLPQVDVEPDAFESMCVEAVKALTVDFDVTAYSDQRTIALAEAFAASTETAQVAGAERTPTPSAPDDMELELQRIIAAGKKKPTAARAAAKKAPAKRPAAKRTAKVA